MNQHKLVEKLWDIVKNYKTVYMWGVFGSPLTEDIIASKAKQYPEWYSLEKQNELRKLINKEYFGFDCVNLIKALVWGWSGDVTKKHGGALYKTNNCPDTSANGMINICKNVTTDFNKIEVGEAVWTDGHIGVYVGDGLVIVCTPIWKNSVQVTCLANIEKSTLYPNRAWKKHGFLPFIEYNVEVEYIKILKNKTDSPDAWIDFVKTHENDEGIGRFLKELIVKLGG